jgi:hypothetical protein
MTLRSRATRYLALQCYDYGVMIAVGLADEAVRGTTGVLAIGTYHSSISWVPRSGVRWCFLCIIDVGYRYPDFRHRNAVS